MRELNLSLASADPEYKDLQDRQVKLVADLADLERQRETVRQRIREAAKQHGAARLNATVARLLGDDDGPDVEVAELHNRFANIGAEIKAHEQALDIARRRLGERRGDASRKVLAKGGEAEHKRAVQELAKALAAAGAAQMKYLLLCDSFEDADLSWTHLGPSPARFLGNPRDPESRIRKWFDEAIAAGHLTMADVPKEWTK